MEEGGGSDSGPEPVTGAGRIPGLQGLPDGCSSDPGTARTRGTCNWRDGRDGHRPWRSVVDDDFVRGVRESHDSYLRPSGRHPSDRGEPVLGDRTDEAQAGRITGATSERN